MCSTSVSHADSQKQAIQHHSGNVAPACPPPIGWLQQYVVPAGTGCCLLQLPGCASSALSCQTSAKPNNTCMRVTLH